MRAINLKIDARKLLFGLSFSICPVIEFTLFLASMSDLLELEFRLCLLFDDSSVEFSRSIVRSKGFLNRLNNDRIIVFVTSSFFDRALSSSAFSTMQARQSSASLMVSAFMRKGLRKKASKI